MSNLHVLGYVTTYNLTRYKYDTIYNRNSEMSYLHENVFIYL